MPQKIEIYRIVADNTLLKLLCQTTILRHHVDDDIPGALLPLSMNLVRTLCIPRLGLEFVPRLPHLPMLHER